MPYLYSVTAGTLPSAFTLSGDGVLSGTASAPGAASFSITVVDALGRTGTAAYTLTIDSAPTCSPTATIAQVQGAGDVSSLKGTRLRFKAS